MSTGYQIYDQSAPYFVTFQIVNWVDLFTRSTYRNIFMKSLKYCQEKKGLEVFAWVIMSNHVHLMIRSSTHDLSGTVRDLKKFSSKAFINAIKNSDESRKDWMLKIFSESNGKHQVWTHENHAEQLYSNGFIQQKLDYIHKNPVKARIVENAFDYLYSSARNYAGMEGLIEVIRVGDACNHRFFG
jgi:REP element-mobilizing transposase RayT